MELERVSKACDLVGQNLIDGGGKGGKSVLRVSADGIGQGDVGPFGRVLESPGHRTVRFYLPARPILTLLFKDDVSLHFRGAISPFVYGDDGAAHEIIVGWKENANPEELG